MIRTSLFVVIVVCYMLSLRLYDAEIERLRLLSSFI